MGWFGCCCPSCLIFSDDFNRSDGAVGGDWTVVAGTWAIATNELSTSVSSGKITSNTAGATDAHTVTVKLYGDTDGDAAQVLVAYTDAKNYLYVQFEFGDCGAIKFYKMSGGAATQLGETRTVSLPSYTQHSVKVCYQPEAYPNDGRLGVKYTDNGVDYYDFEEVNATGTKAGLGVGTLSGSVQFDDFYHYKHSDEDSRCPDCDSPRDDCTIFSDDFNRADSTDLGCDWEEAAGNWAIYSNKLEISAGSATALVEHWHPRVTPFSVVSVTVGATANGDEARVIVDWVDSNNYHYAQFTWGTGGSGELALVKVSGGTPTTLDSESLSHNHSDSDVTITVCIRDDTIEAQAGSLASVIAATTPHSGRRAGVATGTASGTVTFDDFSWAKGKSDDDPGCDDCIDADPVGCSACPDGFPTHVKVRFTGIGNGLCTSCSDFNGSFVLDRDPDGFCAHKATFGPLTSCGSSYQVSVFWTATQVDGMGNVEKVRVQASYYNIVPQFQSAEFDYDDLTCLQLDELELTPISPPYSVDCLVDSSSRAYVTSL